MKKFFSCILIVSFLFTFSGSVLATSINEKSSSTLSEYNAKLISGNSSGDIKLIFTASSLTHANSVGISTIRLYKSNGSYVTTIVGTSTNGLLAKNALRHSGTYTYSGTSKTSYYAVVTFTATINGVTDTKSFTTNTMKAP